MGFVGRSLELSLLREAYEQASSGTGRTVAIVGEAGIGKTALVEHFAASIGPDATHLHGYSADIDGEPPYAPWSRALAALRELSAEDAGPSLGASRAVIQRWLRPSRGFGAGEQVLSPHDERLLLWDGVVTLVERAAAARPVILVIEDIHWADSDSLRLLRTVAEAARGLRVLVIVTTRDDASEGAKLLPGLMRELGLMRIALRGLDIAETRELLLTGGSHVPSFLVSALHEETRGNVLFLRELWQHLIEEGRILNGDGRWSSNFSLGEMALPRSVHDLVESRLRRLGEATQRVMRDGCFFRSGFRLYDLEQVWSGESATLLAALEQAVVSGLVVAPREAGGLYTFSHALVRRTLYEAINPDRRALAHRRLAEALAAGAEGSWQSAAEIATQYAASATLPGAEAGIPFALAAARLAQQSTAYDGSVHFLRLACSLSPQRQQREQILAELVIAESYALLFDEASATANLALAELEDGSEVCAAAAGALREAGAARSYWEPLVERGLHNCRERSLTWARLRLMCDNVEPLVTGAVNVSYWTGRDPEALQIAREQGDELDLARTLDPYDARSEEETAQAKLLVRRFEHPLAMMRGLDAIGRDLLYRRADLREAIVCFEELVDVARRCGSVSGQAEALVQLAYCYIAVDRVADSSAAQQHSRALGARLGPRHRVHVVSVAVANMFAYITGDTSQIAAAAETLRRAASSAETGRGPLGLTLGGHAAMASALAGEARAAL
ncbi:MAG TPA: AAA family ATPase, partial [Polyangiaceae bacterium]|nr:AAA family ATPase [Polyangiaceae bacterium]